MKKKATVILGILVLCTIVVFVVVKYILPKDPIVIEDIKWEVVETIKDGKRVLSLDYVNDTDYTILELEIKFKQKEGVEKEVKEALTSVGTKLNWIEETYKNACLKGRNSKCANPGEKVTDSYLRINGTSVLVTDMALFNMMEPDIATIVYLQDDKAYAMYYDFKTGKYTESDEGGKEVRSWSDSDMANMLPKADFTVVTVSIDKEDYFSFEAFDVVKKSFKEYVEDVKDNGFDNVEFEGENYYRLSNDEGIEVIIDWNPEEESMYVNIEIED